MAQRDNPCCLLLTGPAELNGFSDATLRGYQAAGIRIATVEITHPYLDASYWPRLIELVPMRSADADLIREAMAMAIADWQPDALEKGRGHRIAGILRTDVGLTETARHLSKLILQPRPEGGQRLLSLLDPAAFEGIWRVCDMSQRDQLCGPIVEWHVVNRWLDWSVYRREHSNGEYVACSLELSAGQWRALGDVRAINRAWASAVAKDLTVSQTLFDRMPLALARAYQYGITDPVDLETFAWHVISVRPEFDRDSRIQTCLRERQADDTYSAAVADLTDADWAAIRRGEAAGTDNEKRSTHER